MDIEEKIGAVRYLSNEHKVYHCRRCQYHGELKAKRNHLCPYTACDCFKCSLVTERGRLSSTLKEDPHRRESGPPKSIPFYSTPIPAVTPNKKTTRGCVLFCRYCKNHGVSNSFGKGHKKACAFYTCPCFECSKLREYNRNMAAQMRVSRKLKNADGLPRAKRASLSSNNASAGSEGSNNSSPELQFQPNNQQQGTIQWVQCFIPIITNNPNEKIEKPIIAQAQLSNQFPYEMPSSQANASRIARPGVIQFAGR